MKYKFITDWLKEYSKGAQDKGFVIGISGGIDSAVTSTLCAETGIPTFVVSLPINGTSELADDHMEWLDNKYENVTPLEFDLTDTFKSFEELFMEPDALASATLLLG